MKPRPNAADRRRANHSVYVVRLRRRAGDADPRPWIYIGSTGLTPDKRFDNHKRGYEANADVHRYGVELLPDLVPASLVNITWDAAQRGEASLARQLRARGYEVVQHAGPQYWTQSQI